MLLSLHLLRLQKQLAFLQRSKPKNLRYLILEYIQEIPREKYALRIDISKDAEIVFSTRELPTQLGEIGISKRAVEEQIPWIKYSDRAVWNQEKKRLGVQHLLFQEGENLLEFSEGNLFLFYQGRLNTPASNGAILPGTARAAILYIAQQLGQPVIERECKLTWLEKGAIPCFSSSLRGLKTIGGHNIELVSRIQSYFWNVEWMEKKEHELCNIFEASCGYPTAY